MFVLLPMAFRGSIWTDYLSGMKAWSELHRHGEAPHPPAQTYPATVEGIGLDTLARYHVRQYADSSINRIIRGQGVLDFPEWPLGLALLQSLMGAQGLRFRAETPALAHSIDTLETA